MEMLILKTLKWKLHFPVPGDIARRLVKFIENSGNLDLVKFYKKVDNYVDLCMSGRFFTSGS
jgi:hypothetical protein